MDRASLFQVVVVLEIDVILLDRSSRSILSFFLYILSANCLDKLKFKSFEIESILFGFIMMSINLAGLTLKLPLESQYAAENYYRMRPLYSNWFLLWLQSAFSL